MLYEGSGLSLDKKDGIFHLILDMKDQKANVLGKLLLEDLKAATEILKNESAQGLIISTAKDNFIFGADITEFKGYFKESSEKLTDWLNGVNSIFNNIEDLSFPTVSCIKGFALGGGFELALTTDFRIATPTARLGLPETKLGIMPGWGGSVRLSRLSGADHAIEWITSGKQYKAADALKIKAIHAVVEDSQLEAAALNTVKLANDGKLNWKEHKEMKKRPLRLSEVERAMTFETAKGFVAGVAGPNYPAPVSAIKVMEKGATCQRDEALKFETETFVKLAHSAVAENLVTVFMGDQYLKRVSKKATKEASKVEQAAVLGAGIMGGGVAYQSASKGTPILMKDINQKALDLGMGEAVGLLNKQLQRGKIDANIMARTVGSITPTLSYGDFERVDLVVEAVVENKEIKKTVLRELEASVSENTIIASNTSTIDISELASALLRPENFCGMHFFNPVHRMPLVEVIRGKKTSEKAISKTVQYALQMGKTPIVVNDCPGFLVNRVLFPYFNGFNLLIEDGVDYQRIDKVMEKFGWPMGPAYLMDVVGVDTGDHAAKIMADAFSRMKMPRKTIVEALHEENRLGQKNKLGFYKYELDRKGKLQKQVDKSVDQVIAKVANNNKDVTDEEIVERMMLPMIFECVRCLDENIVETPVEVDMGLILGLGFPPFRGGALKYADDLGANKLVELSQKYSELGELYEAPKYLLEMAKNNKRFYQG